MSLIRSTILICLLGFVLVCRAAPSDNQSQLSPSTRGEGSETSAGPQGPSSLTTDNGDERTDDDYYSDDGEGEYQDAQESAEESLSELAEEHYGVKADCDNLKRMINDAKQSNSTAQVDPELQQAYTQCRQYLSQLEQQIQQVSAALIDNGRDDS